MMSKKITFYLASLVLLSGAACEDDFTEEPVITGSTIAGYEVAKENVLRDIPTGYIDAARENLHVSYQHTSHGTHVSYGLYGLPDFKAGDNIRFGVTKNSPESGKLDIRDNVMEAYAEAGRSAVDLSADETAFIQATRNYLEDPENSEINVVIWSWCSIANHDVTGNYLPGMQALIEEYGEEGSRIGTGAEKRLNPVTFIFMTGHAETGSNTGAGKPADQAQKIIDFCEENGYYCLDYYGIDTHDLDDNYWVDAGDNGNSSSYGGNFYEDWQNAHTENVDYFNNRSEPGGWVLFGEHNTQHITSNRKAYAMWYILARISGWDGQ
jgi:hypothetical protein